MPENIQVQGSDTTMMPCKTLARAQKNRQQKAGQAKDVNGNVLWVWSNRYHLPKILSMIGCFMAITKYF
jgi:hypothetical protein